MNVLFYVIWAIVFTVFQPTLMRSIEICDIAPNLFLCFVVCISFIKGKTEGAIIGAIFGLLYDLLVGRMIGVSSLALLLLGYGAGILGNQFFDGKLIVCAVTAFICTLLYGVIYYIARRIGWNDISFSTAFFRISLMEGIYNGVVCVVLAFPTKWTMRIMGLGRTE